MYSVNIRSERQSEFKVRSENQEFTIDSEGEKGITPPATLLAALGSCVGVYIRKYCKNTSFDIKEFNVTVEAELSADKPVRFTKIYVKINITGGQIDEMRKKSILSFVKNCPVHNTLKLATDIETEII